MDGAPQTGERGYRVLARKYRPDRFDDLIGQEAMIRTLANAFKAGRIAQAWMLTGVRGVGKTTTARILARALNYELPGSVEQPTIEFGEPGIHCQAIMEGRHVDVIEMDAASHTGIGDVREIIEAARYKPVSARYKVYIIDEVHMLSTQAFNGLLKTLEEPPDHVKFVFATTEIRKVPVTILSRCQRFDLRRIHADELVSFLHRIAEAETVEIEPEALAMIARAAEGSVRDSLSLLDQAIAHGAAAVTADTVRAMLGLADRARVIDLFEAVMRGDIATALATLKEQYDIGAEPQIMIADLGEFTHLVTKFKVAPDYDGGPAITELERDRGRDFAASLSMRALSRAWQILLKGFAEVEVAPRPLAAADMVLVRLCYAADLPTPDELVRRMRDDAASEPAPDRDPGPGGPAASVPEQASGPSRTAEAVTAFAPPAAAAAGAAAPMPREPEPEPEPEPEAARQLALVAAPAPGDEAPAAAATLTSLAEIAELLGERRDLTLKFAVERQIRPIAMQPGRLEIAVEPGAPADLAPRLGRFLQDVTGDRWMVIVSRDGGGDTLHEVERRQQQRVLSDAAAHPEVAAVLEAFPGARIVDVRVLPTEDAADAGGEDEPAGSGEDADDET